MRICDVLKNIYKMGVTFRKRYAIMNCIFLERTELLLKTDLFDLSRYQLFHRKFTRWMLILSLVYSAGIMPVLNLVNSNILYSETVLSPVLDLVLLVCGYLIYWVAFSYLLYGISRFGLQACKRLVWIFVGVSFLRPALGFLMTYWMGLDALDVLDVRDFLVSAVVDCLQLGIAVWIITKHEKRLLAKHKTVNHLPLPGLFTQKNPVPMVIAKLSAVPAGIYLITRVIYDMTAVFVSAPETMWEYLWMFMGYFSDVVFAFVGYMVMVLIVNSIALTEERARLAFEDASWKPEEKKKSKK